MNTHLSIVLRDIIEARARLEAKGVVATSVYVSPGLLSSDSLTRLRDECVALGLSVRIEPLLESANLLLS